MTKIQQLAIQQVMKEIDEARRIIFKNTETFPDFAKTDSPVCNILVKLNAAEKWLEAIWE